MKVERIAPSPLREDDIRVTLTMQEAYYLKLHLDSTMAMPYATALKLRDQLGALDLT